MWVVLLMNIWRCVEVAVCLVVAIWIASLIWLTYMVFRFFLWRHRARKSGLPQDMEWNPYVRTTLDG
jgi:heme/copper-type cytochrome/quinol oxidase subunit 2